MSEKYIYEKDVSYDEQLIAILRQKINEWGNNIPHHDFYNLGDQIEVLSLWYKPSYPIRFSSQFETRVKGKSFHPYKNESIPQRKYDSLNDFEAWDIDHLPEVNQFENNEGKFYVQGSQYVTQCHTCSGRGVVTCPKCKGQKKTICPNCRGTGRDTCEKCNGKGETVCKYCEGAGGFDRQYKNSSGDWYTTRENCACNGRGAWTCNICKGNGKIDCNGCKGSGKVTCTKCKGKGVTQCQTCQGKRELLHYFYIHRKLGYTDYESCISHGDVYNHFPEYNENYQNYKSEDIYVDNQQSITKEDVPDCEHLIEYVNEYIVKARNDAGNWDYQHFQQLSISCINTWELKYRFNGKDYVMLFAGSNYEVVPGLSPVSEVTCQQWNNAVSLTKKYSYLKAYNTLLVAAEMNVHELKEQVSTARKKILKKINDAYFFGSIAGMILSMFFGGFIAYGYFNEVNLIMDYAGFINRETNWFYSYHAWSQTAFFLFLCYSSHQSTMKTVKKFKKIIPGSPLRTITALLLTVLFSAFMLSMWALINATGLTFLMTIVGIMLYWMAYVAIWLIVIVGSIILGIIIGIWELF